MRNHEIIEAVVTSICEAFEIEDWRKLRTAEGRCYETKIARWALIVLMADELKCTLSEVHDHFSVFASRYTNSQASKSIRTLIFTDYDVKSKYLKSRNLIKERYLVHPDSFIFLPSKIR